MRDYISAIKHLPSFAQKQGYAPVEGKKDEIAKYFGATAASFDAFQSRFSDLIRIDDSFSRGRAGSVKFIRHPLEETIFASLEDSTTTTKRNGEVRKALRLDYIYGGALDLGYRKDEVKYVLEIMQARDLIELNAEWIMEKPRPDISPRKIQAQILDFKRQTELLVKANQQPDAKQMLTRAEQHLKRFKELDEHENEIELIILGEQVEADIALLETVIAREITMLRENIARLELDVFAPDGADILGTIIHAGAFTAAINQIRVKHNQTLNQWRSTASIYQEGLAELERESDDLSIQSLQRIREKVNQLKQKHLDLNDQRRMLNSAVGKIRIWQDVSDLLHTLLGSIQVLGKPAERLLQELQNIENRIAQSFQQEPERAFDQPISYQEQLLNLEVRLDRFSSQAERDFNQLQDQYRELFIRYAGNSPDNLWQKIFYSSNNVEGVYSNLYSAIEKQVTDLLDNLFIHIEQSNDNILALRARNSEATGNIDHGLNDIQQALDNIDDEYTQLTEKVDTSTIQSVGKFKVWMESFSLTSKRIRNINVSLQNLREQPDQPSFSVQEKSLINAVNHAGSSGSLIRVRQEIGDLDNETFWQTLRELWERQIVEISIKTVD